MCSVRSFFRWEFFFFFFSTILLGKLGLLRSIWDQKLFEILTLTIVSAFALAATTCLVISGDGLLVPVTRLNQFAMNYLVNCFSIFACFKLELSALSRGLESAALPERIRFSRNICLFLLPSDNRSNCTWNSVNDSKTFTFALKCVSLMKRSFWREVNFFFFSGLFTLGRSAVLSPSRPFRILTLSLSEVFVWLFRANFGWWYLNVSGMRLTHVMVPQYIIQKRMSVFSSSQGGSTGTIRAIGAEAEGESSGSSPRFKKFFFFKVFFFWSPEEA